MAPNRLKERVAFVCLAGLSVAKDEADSSVDIAAAYTILHGLQKLSGSFISSRRKPADVQHPLVFLASLAAF